jgi:hypothetical protein
MPPMPSMPPESSPGSTGLDDPRLRPADRGPEGEPLDEPRDEPDPGWPDDWPDHDQAGPSWPGMAPPPARGGGAIPGRRALALAVVALVALAAGAGVAAAVTSSTRVTGRVSSIRSVKTGDLVTAQITQSGGQATVTAIQDPAQLPPGTSAP